MHFIGDVHGKIGRYLALIREMDCSVQLGDLGLGFPQVHLPNSLDPGHRFIRGNHDKPEAFYMDPNYLGDYGFLEETDLFFLSGAYSVDRGFRRRDVDLWADEELSGYALLSATRLYRESKPKIVATHDCPERVARAMLRRKPVSTRTGAALDDMLDIHEPEYWFFGHYHISFRRRIGRTRFVGLSELETYCLEGVPAVA